MQQRAMARPRYPASATYLFRIQPIEQYQARKLVFCITRSTNLHSALIWTWASSAWYPVLTDSRPASHHPRPITVFVPPTSQQLYFCSVATPIGSLCVFVLGSVALPLTTFHPSPHAFLSTFPALNSLLTLTLALLSPIDVLINSAIILTIFSHLSAHHHLDIFN